VTGKDCYDFLLAGFCKLVCCEKLALWIFLASSIFVLHVLIFIELDCDIRCVKAATQSVMAWVQGDRTLYVNEMADILD
jgi:hypothetical protein